MSEKNKSSDFEIQSDYIEEDIRLEGEELPGFGDSIDDLDDKSKSSIQDIMSDKRKLIMFGGVGLIFVIIVIVIIIGIKGGNKPIVDLEAAPLPYVDKTMTEMTMRFTSDQVSRLREVGYVGREIQEAEINGKDAEEMYNDALIKKDEFLKERYKFLSKEITAVEVRKILDSTWYGLPQQTVNAPVINPDTGEEDMSMVFINNESENVDYERVPFYGHQCFIKLYLKDNIIIYADINPGKYLNIPDKGNVKVRYSKMNYRGAVFVFDIIVEEF